MLLNDMGDMPVHIKRTQAVHGRPNQQGKHFSVMSLKITGSLTFSDRINQKVKSLYTIVPLLCLATANFLKIFQRLLHDEHKFIKFTIFHGKLQIGSPHRFQALKWVIHVTKGRKFSAQHLESLLL